ncbi:MAG: protease pro-enzyme activation domain-containing protein [Terriglobales bacterium]
MRRLANVPLAALALAAAALAQAPVRLHQPVNDAQRVRVAGNTPRQARAARDLGAVAAAMPLQHMLLLLRRSGQQELALRQLLDEQREAGSPQYHRWLTPEQFGAQFGPAAADIATVESWLRDQGLTIERVTAGGLAIEFSGTAGTVEAALGTGLHRYQAADGVHMANVADPAIPAALAPVVAGVVSLNGFRARPTGRVVGHGTAPTPHAGEPLPNLNYISQYGITGNALAPGDLAIIYNIDPLYTLSPSIRGQGETVAVVARSDVNPKDVETFRQLFLPGAPANVLTTVEVGADPGIATNGDEDEATLDAEWAGAADPGANVDLVVSGGSQTTDGMDLAALYIVDQNLAPVVTTSFGECEADLGATENQFWASLWQQAAAQGMTALVSAGDSGAAGCDNPNTEVVATGGLAVNGMASTPYDTAIGGTEFAEYLSNGTAYWSASNASSDYHSALGYIPEEAWNEQYASAEGLWAGGGGASQLYAKPAWQVGAGPRNDGQRDVPDVSLTASAHDGYVICEDNSCSGAPNFTFAIVSGTSAAAPSLAGIMALVVQQTGSRQGLANPVLYRLEAAVPVTACSTTGPPEANCDLLDTVSGNNRVMCTLGTPDCSGGDLGYDAGPGYDLATGLGSVNAANLVQDWHTIGLAASSTSLSLTLPSNPVHGESVPVAVQVAPGGTASATPTGSVALLAEFSDGSLATVQTFTLGGSGAVSATTSQLPGGSYSVVAFYSGDGTFGSSVSAPVAVSVGAENAAVALELVQKDAQGNLTPVSSITYGAEVYARATVAGGSGTGTPTGTISITAATGLPPLNATDLPLNGQAVAIMPEPLMEDAGSYSFTAQYSGDNSFNAAISAPVSLSIAKCPTSIVLSAGPEDQYVITKTEMQGYVGYPPGMMEVYVNGSDLGVTGGGTLGTDPVTGYTEELGDWTPTTPLSGASASISMTFAGDRDLLPSTSNTLVFTTPANLLYSPAALDFGTVAVGGTSAAQTVKVSNVGGLTATLSEGIYGGFGETDNCGAELAPGASCTVSVVYRPENTSQTKGEFSLGPGPEVTLTGIAEGFSVTGPSGWTTTSVGVSANVALSLQPAGGFTGPVTLACSSLPPLSSCSFSPAQPTLSGSTPTSVTLTITTTAPPAGSGSSAPAWWWWTLAGLGGGTLLLTRARPRRRWRWAPALAGVLVMAACGGSSAPGPVTPINNNPAPSTPMATLSPTSLDLGTSAVGVTSAPQTLTFTNIGTVAIADTSLYLFGVADSGFVATPSCPASIAAGAGCGITVTFTPKTPGKGAATFLLSYGGAATLTAALSGSGAYTSTPPGDYTVTVTGTAGAVTASTQVSFIVQ